MKKKKSFFDRNVQKTFELIFLIFGAIDAFQENPPTGMNVLKKRSNGIKSVDGRVSHWRTIGLTEVCQIQGSSQFEALRSASLDRRVYS